MSAPIFHETPSVEYKHSDESVSMQCKVYGNPVPTVTWMLDDNLLNFQDFKRVKVSTYNFMFLFIQVFSMSLI